jgi:hypothetical protein
MKIKKNDVVVNRQGRIFQVMGFGSSNSMGGEVLLCRLYRSQKRFALKASDVKKHPFFA